jgi:hypothetical protein
MSTHPWTHHEIARLRYEERLVRGRILCAPTGEAKSLAGDARDTRVGDRLMRALRARLGSRRGPAVHGVPRLLS